MGARRKGETRSISIRKTISLSPSKARKKVNEAAKKAMERISEFEPLTLKKPFKLKVEYIDSKYADEKMNYLGVTRLDDLTIMKECSSINDVIF